MQGSPSPQPGAVTERPRLLEPAPELARLERLVGTWSGSAQLMSGPAEHLKGMMPDGSGGGPPSCQGGGTYRWVLGGMFLEGQGWHETGGGRRVEYVEYVAWDPKAKRYRNWWFSNTGEHAQGWMSLEPDGKTIRAMADGVDAQGTSKHSDRTMTFVDDDTMNWTWSKAGPLGEMKLTGISKRQP